jgi:hypothetical protein
MKMTARILLSVAAGTAALTTASAEGWDKEAAARYLDSRMDLWFERASELKTGDAKTSCISCHTVLPYMLSRPVLRKTMQVIEPAPQERKLIKEIALRVETYPKHESMSDPKHGGERGTEAVLNAVMLAQWDAVAMIRQEPSALTQKAFQQLWETQSDDGAWDWMNFGEEPDETADARYYGAALAAFAVSRFPILVKSDESGTASYLDRLRSYLKDRFDEQNLYRKTWSLFASARLTGVLTSKQQDSLIAELRAKQNPDGGWSLYKLGPWRWSNTTAPFGPPGAPNLATLEASDGYGTALVICALRESGVPTNDGALQRAKAWLETHQTEVEIDQKAAKCWRTRSLNHDREGGGVRGGAWKQMLMSDAATAFAVLALLPSETR